jgi:hypothetical protein
MTFVFRLCMAIFQGMLRFYPRAFRAEYGVEMLRVFRDTCRVAQRVGGTRALLRVWFMASGDVLVTALQERWAERGTMPKTTVMQIMGLFVIAGALLSFSYAIGYPLLTTAHPNGRLATNPAWFLAVFVITQVSAAVAILGVFLHQRGRVGRIALGLAMLGWFIGFFFDLLLGFASYIRPLLNFLSHYMSIPLLIIGDVGGAVLLLGGLLVGSIVTLLQGVLGRWSSVPLILTLWLGFSRAVLIKDQHDRFFSDLLASFTLHKRLLASSGPTILYQTSTFTQLVLSDVPLLLLWCILGWTLFRYQEQPAAQIVANN